MQIARARRAAARRVPPAAAATPPGTGVLIRASQTALVDIEVTGTADAAIVVDGTSFAAMAGGDVSAPPRIRRGR
jgi:hypothetical protein